MPPSPIPSHHMFYMWIGWKIHLYSVKKYVKRLPVYEWNPPDIKRRRSYLMKIRRVRCSLWFTSQKFIHPDVIRVYINYDKNQPLKTIKYLMSTFHPLFLKQNIELIIFSSILNWSQFCWLSVNSSEELIKFVNF